GLTGPTQLAHLDEAAQLPPDVDPTEHYVRDLLPNKLEQDLQYVRSRTFMGDVRILLRTPICLSQFALSRPRLGRLLKLSRLSTDIALVGLATYAAFFARFDGDIPASEVRSLVWGLPFVVAAYAFAFLFFGTFRSIWRFASVGDFWQLAKACAIGGGITQVGMHSIGWPWPRSVLLMSPAIALLFLGSPRLTLRTLSQALAKMR